MAESTTSKATSLDRSRGSWVGYGAALWSLVFAALHVVWAMGWYVGLPQELARNAFHRQWFLVYDLVAAGLCALAVAVALALVKPWGRRLPRSLIGVLAWGAAGLLILRSGASIVKALYLKAAGGNLSAAFSFWDVWFCFGAILFGVSIWRFWHAPVLRDLRRRAEL